MALPALVPAADAARKTKLPKAPAGSRFYSPPKKLVKGRAGTPIWTRTARGLVRPPHAGRVLTIAYRSTSIRNRATVMTGTISLPKGKAPKQGWPVVTFGHVTTGGADNCAPSRVTAGNTELERMTRSNEVVGYLLAHRVAVARPDFEGIGTPGRHPYLIGSSLARSMTDIVRAGRKLKLGRGRRWAAAGHSEGGMAALWTAKVGPRRTLNMPGVSATVGEEIEALKRFAGPEAAKLIRREPDPAIDAIVQTWAQRFDPQRALALGFRADASLAEIIKVFLEDELGR